MDIFEGRHSFAFPTRSKFVGAVAIALCASVVSACGGQAPAKAVQMKPASVALTKAPSSLSIVVSGRTASVTWVAPSGGSLVRGYRLFFDEQAPLDLPATPASHTFDSLKAGSQHLVQVVSLSGAEQSLPVSASFDVPDAEPKREPRKVVASQPPAEPDRPASGDFTASGSIQIALTLSRCGSIGAHYKVQVYEEHDAYVGDATIGSSGKFVGGAGGGGAHVCQWQFTMDLPSDSTVYTFKLLQYRSGSLQDEQKMLTSSLRMGNGPVLTGNG